MEAKRKEDLEWKQLKSYIATLREIDEADGTKTMPPSQIVKYFGMIPSRDHHLYPCIPPFIPRISFHVSPILVR